MAMGYNSCTAACVGFVLLLVFNQSYLGNAADQGQGLGASFIFGDSLVDAGNNNYLPTLSKANMVPNGIDFKASGGKPTGRFTNGRTIGDIVGNNFFPNIIQSRVRTRKIYISDVVYSSVSILFIA